MPPPLKEDEEIKYLNLKHELVKVTEDFINKIDSNNDKIGKIDLGYINLTKSESKGMETLQKRKDIVVFQTDKSGRMAIDSKEGYIKATEPHIINDPIIQENIHVEC